ncbi:MAG TPA: beta-ketoacyl-[acyl-carrier-protein] synthase family protein [Lacipirellulaceae bacterium]|nr:beta-ketoacyl-[acyl-carrier-protein] synthase family protein [Lacipirellulaceae bacterium]
MSSALPNKRRVVITGLGLISPLGNTPSALWSALMAGKSGVAMTSILPVDRQPLKYAAECREFTGEIDDFGPLEKERKKAIKKGLKVMCRETRMAVAAAQLAIADAGFSEQMMEPEKSGVVLGSDYMLTMPADYAGGMRACAPEGEFEYSRWGAEGLGDMEPLWMLKYLPNMPASHIAIFNDLRGPNNSLTMREAAGNLAIGEAFRTIQRGHANLMVAGATGTRILPMQAIHALQTEQMAAENCDPTKASRPFDKNRTGMVAGEGAAMIVLEELSSAKSRGATIYAEVLGLGSANVARRVGGAHQTAKNDGGPCPPSELQGTCDVALARAMKSALLDACCTPGDVGHINAHGLSTTERDADEARAIHEVFDARAMAVPVAAIKSYFGNLGAGSAVVELIASVLALREGRLPRVLNYQTRDPACQLAVVAEDGVSAGRSFLNLSVTPQGQAAVLYVAAVE